MAFASITYTSASGTTFALTNNDGNAIEYLRQSDISVTVNGTLQTLTTDYTFNAAGTAIVLNSAVSGATVVLSRTTSITDATVSFTAGSTLTAQDLNNSDRQNRFALQEFSDIYDSLLTGTGDLGDLGGFIDAGETWVSDAAHAATTDAIDARVDSKIDSALTGDVAAGNAITITDNSPASGQITIAVTDGAIDTAELANNAVTTAKITDSNVTTAKINDAAVTTAKIADANVTTAKIANDAITSAKIADGTIIAGDIANNAITTAKILDANVTTAKIADSNVTTAKINDAAVTEAKIAGSAVTSGKIASGSIDSTKLSGATVVTNAEHSGSTPNDTSFFTTSASDARYFRQDSSETISSGDTWSGSDSFIATTAAIDARVIDLVDDVGGFVPIANETSFPATNPDINNPDGTGTIISVAEIATSRTPSSGTVTIANGSGSNTVTINGCGTTVLAAGFGVLVETTSTLHTYTFHRLVPKATEVTTVAGISSNITTVANNVSDITTVANDLNEATSEIETVANSISNVDAVGGSIANVNTVATNIASVNSFANVYRIDSADPTTSLDVGDLVFNTSNNKLRVYNGTSWQDGVTATGDLVSKTGDTMTGALGITSGSAGSPSLFISGDPNTGIYSPGADQVAISTNGTQRLSIGSTGSVNITSTLYVDTPNFRVGLGTASPSEKLTVVGSIDLPNVNSYIKGGGHNVLQVDATKTYFYGGTNGVQFRTADNTSDLINITNAGLVGVGTSSPQTLLHLSGLNSGVGSANTIRVTDTDTAVVTDQICGRIEFETADTGNPGINCQIDALYSGSGGGSKLQFRTGFAGALVDALHISDTGQVGIGTTSPQHALVVGSGTDDALNVDTQSAGGGVVLRSYDDGTTDYEPFGIAAEYVNFYIRTGVNSSAEKARIDSSGRLLVGTSTASTAGNAQYARFRVSANTASSTGDGILVLERGEPASTMSSGDRLGRIIFSGNTGGDFAYIDSWVDGTPSGSVTPGRLVFSTTADGASSPTERMRIAKDGRHFTFSAGALTHRSPNGANSSDALFIGLYSGTSTTSGGAASFYVRTNGNVENTNNSYGAISDIKLKENIVDAKPQWGDIKALQVRNYNFKEGQTHTQIGLVAQEVELVSPGLVSESPDRDEDGNDLGTVTKSVNYSVLYMKAVKALQEAMERIEVLEQRLTDAGIA